MFYSIKQYSKGSIDINRRLFRLSSRVIPLFLLAMLSACTTFHKAQNVILDQANKPTSYSIKAHTTKRPIGDHLFLLSFSGGGTRASALSYGVMKELRNTHYVDSDNHKKNLLDDVDFISAVSGGSFTAAYYGAFGDDMFPNFEKDFLHLSVEEALFSKIFSPSHMFRSLMTGFDRTESAIEYYDKKIFKGKTFGDIAQNDGPFILINASDLSGGTRFGFTQDNFNLICSDLSTFPLARAVTASSAVPVAFPSVILRNFAGQCKHDQSDMMTRILSLRTDTVKRRAARETIRSYLDSEKRPYIHLVDGGITDNLGLRAISDRIHILGIDRLRTPLKNVKRITLILVNSEVTPQKPMDLKPKSPSIAETIGAVTDTMMARLNIETRATIFGKNNVIEQAIRKAGGDAKVRLIEVSFESIHKKSLKRFFNSLPTSLELGRDEVDSLVIAGAELLRRNLDYQSLVEELNATMPEVDEIKRKSILEKLTTSSL
ncbi:MAG: patatin [Moraxellaceae bacterium]|nr:MAG: patatin [Moraxellaceae bacterium]